MSVKILQIIPAPPGWTAEWFCEGSIDDPALSNVVRSSVVALALVEDDAGERDEEGEELKYQWVEPVIMPVAADEPCCTFESLSSAWGNCMGHGALIPPGATQEQADSLREKARTEARARLESHLTAKQRKDKARLRKGRMN